jgi:hypothetical protein
VVRAVMRARRHGEVAHAVGKEHGKRRVQVRGYDEVACNGEAQGDVGARQCRHVLPSPRVIAVVASSLSVVGPCELLRERVCLSARRPIERGYWAAKEEVSKKNPMRTRT